MQDASVVIAGKSFPVNISPSEQQRFWTLVDKRGECWLWKGRQAKWGYGVFLADGKRVLAHRAAYGMCVGEVSGDMFICHHCDNPQCVRPDHLFQGTPDDNWQDCKRKGRHSHGPSHGAVSIPKTIYQGEEHWTAKKPEVIAWGEKINTAKLTRQQVLAIRKRYAAGGITQKALAIEYRVSISNLNRIVHGTSWVRA